MANIKWDHSKFLNDTKKKGVDGLEEFALGVWKPQAQSDCPVKSGTMKNSLTTERDDAKSCVYVGGGGAASSYILTQEMDRSIHHRVGKAGFILDSVNMHSHEIPDYVKKHVQ